MADTLNLFPTRAAIGTADASGAVYMTPEFSRALATLLVRVGGPVGLGTNDLAQVSGTGDSARVAALLHQLEEITLRLAQAEAVVARVAKLSRAVADVEQLAAFRDPFRVNWERPGALGSLTPNTVKATTLESTIATGTAPLKVASTTQVVNLNASQLVGKDWASPGAIGGTAPAAGIFTTLNTTGACTFGNSASAIGVNLYGNTVVGAGIGILNGGVAKIVLGNKSAVVGGAYDATPYLQTAGTLLTSSGLQVTGTWACNGKAAQGPAASGGTLAGVIAALVANGILSS